MTSTPDITINVEITELSIKDRLVKYYDDLYISSAISRPNDIIFTFTLKIIEHLK